MADHRPLFKHIRNHDALFSELALLRGEYVTQLGLKHHEFHKTPKFITPDGRRLTIEPERSIVVPNVDVLKGVKSQLEKALRAFISSLKVKLVFATRPPQLLAAMRRLSNAFAQSFFTKTVKTAISAAL